MKQPTTLGDLMDRYWDRVQAQKAKDAAERKAAITERIANGARLSRNVVANA